MGLDRKPERLRAVADICARMAAPGVVARLDGLAEYVLNTAVSVMTSDDPAYAYGAALECMGHSLGLAAAEQERAIVDIFGRGASR